MCITNCSTSIEFMMVMNFFLNHFYLMMPEWHLNYLVDICCTVFLNNMWRIDKAWTDWAFVVNADLMLWLLLVSRCFLQPLPPSRWWGHRGRSGSQRLWNAAPPSPCGSPMRETQELFSYKCSFSIRDLAIHKVSILKSSILLF